MSNKKRLINISIIGYSLILISFIGFFAYYLPSQDSTIWQWIVVLLLGSFFVGYKTTKVSSDKKLKTAIFDLLYIFLLFALASLELSYGLNFILVAVLGALLIIPMLKYSLDAWNN